VESGIRKTRRGRRVAKIMGAVSPRGIKRNAGVQRTRISNEERPEPDDPLVTVTGTIVKVNDSRVSVADSEKLESGESRTISDRSFEITPDSRKIRAVERTRHHDQATSGLLW
jgi:hypothetical protein